MNKGIVYRTLRPNWFIFGVKVSLTCLGFLTAAAMVIAALCEYAGSRDYGSLFGVGLVSIALCGIIANIVIKSLKNEKKSLERRKKILGAFDACSLERLEEEVGAAKRYFKCIYVLDEYLFVPKAGLLLSFSDVRSYRSIYHSTNSINDAVFVEIYDRENIKYYFSVNKWREYKANYGDFMALLESKGVFKKESSGENGVLTSV